MLRSLKGRLSFANVISMTALFIVLGAGAYAAAKIDSSDIKNSTIVSKDIKNKKGVKGKDVKDGSITGADIGDGSVASADVTDGSLAAADLANDEPYHVLGAAGEPAYGNGGQGDCLWSDGGAALPGAVDPVGFYKDKNGRVHFTGIPTVVNGPGGDAACGPADGLEDLTMFTLPAGYRPDNIQEQIASDGVASVLVVIGASTDTDLGGTIIPAGAVIPVVSAPETITFDGTIDFRAAGTGSGFTRGTTRVGSGEVPPLMAEALERIGE